MPLEFQEAEKAANFSLFPREMGNDAGLVVSERR